MAIAKLGDAGEVGGAEIPDLLRLIGAGATGAILLALGKGPLRTSELAREVPGFGPRTVYRYVTRLVDLEVVEREEEATVPSKVVYRLTEPCGTELYKLVDLYSTLAFPDERGVPHAWTPLKLLGDLQSFGMFEELNRGPCTATQLAALGHSLSFHQVRRRIDLYLFSQVIGEAIDGSRQRHYELTKETREAMAMVVGLGGWRERYLEPNGNPGLTRPETAGVLRAVLPLVVLPGSGGKSFNLVVLSSDLGNGDGREVVRVEVDADGGLLTGDEKGRPTDGWAQGEVRAWIEALLRGGKGEIRIDSRDVPLIEGTLQGMHDALWTRRETEPR
jgi:DNA-binding HxlR family transcriptional regulator